MQKVMRDQSEIIEDLRPCKLLISEIVGGAIREYITARRKLECDPDNYNAQRAIARTRTFLTSEIGEWYISNLDIELTGAEISEMLERMDTSAFSVRQYRKTAINKEDREEENKSKKILSHEKKPLRRAACRKATDWK